MQPMKENCRTCQRNLEGPENEKCGECIKEGNGEKPFPNWEERQ